MARIQTLEAAKKNLEQENANLTEEVTRLRLENEKIKAEKEDLTSKFGVRENEVKSRLESLLSEVEKIELEIS